MFLVRPMNAAQHYRMAHTLYLLNKSRALARHEPLSDLDDQTRYVSYCHHLMDHIEAGTLEPFEVDAHLWALSKTHQRRLSKIKDRQIMRQIGASK